VPIIEVHNLSEPIIEVRNLS